MKWILLISFIVNGSYGSYTVTPFETQEQCSSALQHVQNNEPNITGYDDITAYSVELTTSCQEL